MVILLRFYFMDLQLYTEVGKNFAFLVKNRKGKLFP